MVSRKRNKGKERKAKKQEEKRRECEDNNNMYNIWRGWARGKEGTGAMWLEKNICCDHGCDITVLDGPSHPVPSFLDAFFMGGRPWLATIKSNPQIWHNCNYRKMVIDILLNVGTNLMLS